MAQSGPISAALDHKITPWLIAGLAYFGTNAFETLQSDGSNVSEDLALIKVDLAVVKNDVEALSTQLSDNAPNRWTRRQHDDYAQNVDRRFVEHDRRLEALERR